MANEPPTIYNTKNGYSTRSCSKDISATAKLLGHDIVHYVSNNNRYVTSSIQNEKVVPVTKTLRRTVDELSQRHEILFRGMVKKLNITPENVNQVFINIADEIFKDKQFNWGRIVSVYAFGGRLAKYISDHNLTTEVDFIGEFIGSYVAETLGWWIESKGGWRAFQEYFPDPAETRIEDNIWKGLLCTAGVGLAALAAVVAVR